MLDYKMVRRSATYREKKLMAENKVLRENLQALKETIFKVAEGYLDAYHYCPSRDDAHWFHQKFIAVYGVIQDAELEEEYYAWKEAQDDE